MTQTVEQALALVDAARSIWETRYRSGDPAANERHVADTWRRIARALASAEARDRDAWEQRFVSAMEDFRFLPGGRVLAGAGSARRLTLFNCFVMGRIDDSLDGIFAALREGAITMQAGGGVGYDFSTLRPRGSIAQRCGTIASGPVSFMNIWDSMCATLQSTGHRRGAMIGTLRCDHPDIEEFVDAKRDPHSLRRFNLSVLVTDAFMAAVRADGTWPLVFPLLEGDDAGDPECVDRVWSGSPAPQRCRIHRRASARVLWERIARAAHDCAEPGVLFIDRIARLDNLAYCEQISATNPCGEIPLPAYGACDLGSINLTRFVREPFTPSSALDFDGIAATARVAVRMLDNVYEVSHFPLEQQAIVARDSRRIGLGLTGLADALAMLGVVYGSERSLAIAGDVMRTICIAAYRASIALAREKGAFPCFDAERYARSEFLRSLPEDVVADIRRDGIRNSHLTAIAPTGSISLLAGNVSSGLEPVFAFLLQRRLRLSDGSETLLHVEDHAHRLYRERFGADAPLPPAFVTAAQVPPRMQLAMQQALQRYVDNAISKTVNVPADASVRDFRDIFDEAHRLGLKGCAAFRPNLVTGSALVPDEPAPARSGGARRDHGDPG
jgi:ribonucleoside-diphosphate reductase alpha chain